MSGKKELHPAKCSICDTKLIGSFCHNCGQKSANRKTSLFDVVNALLSGVFSVERGILGSLKELTIRPKKVVENYWAGNRYYHFSPGQMIFITLFVVGLHLAFVNKRILGFHVELTGLEGGAATLFSPQLLFMVLLLPLFSLTTLFTFYKQRKTFPEHFIAATYIFCYSIIVWTVLGNVLQLAFALPPLLITAPFLLFLFLWGTRIYAGGKKWYFFLSMVLLQVLVFVFLFGILITLLFLFNPDAVNFSGGDSFN